MSAEQKEDFKLSLPTAILINVNIMLGAGIFINTPTLAKNAGLLGAFMYLLIGVLMLPLILSIAELLKKHPSGGFYSFGKNEINPFVGFLSGWCYFTSKVASCMLMIHVSITLLQHIFPSVALVNTFLLDSLVVSLFCGLNSLNIKAGSAIQKLFMGFKTFPILFAIGSGIFLLQPDNFSSNHMLFEGVPTSLPLVIYAVIGFEAACSMSGKIKNAEKNAPKAVLISFTTVILIAAVYQAIFYGALGEKLGLCDSHCDIFPLLIQSLFGDTLFAHKFEGILHLAIASSTLGAAYGIIFSNSWNLHTLAQNNHLLYSKFFAKLNRSQIPFACVVIEGILCLAYLASSQGVLVPLQQIGALGCVISYTLSVGALFFSLKNQSAPSISRWVPRLGLISCSILITACIRSFFINGMSSLVIFSIFLLIGIAMFLASSKAAVEETAA